MTTDERWKVNLLHIHIDLLTVQFYPTRPCCKDLRQVAKCSDRVNLVHRSATFGKLQNSAIVYKCNSLSEAWDLTTLQFLKALQVGICSGLIIAL